MLNLALAMLPAAYTGKPDALLAEVDEGFLGKLVLWARPGLQHRGASSATHRCHDLARRPQQDRRPAADAGSSVLRRG